MSKKDKQRLSREDWLAHALETLGAEGAVGLRVEPMARSLGVTPGSFYWHFRDRDDLCESVLDYWENELSRRNTARLDDFGGDTRERFLRLLQIIVELGLNKYDAAIRAWANSDLRAAACIRRVDARRLEFVTDLFLGMGFSREQADFRARLSYYYAIGEETIALDVTEEERQALLRLRWELLTQGAPNADS